MFFELPVLVIHFPVFKFKGTLIDVYLSAHIHYRLYVCVVCCYPRIKKGAAEITLTGNHEKAFLLPFRLSSIDFKLAQ